MLENHANEGELFAAILEHMADGVVVCDQSWLIRYTNPAFNRMCGYEHGELLGQSVAILNAEGSLEIDEVKRCVGECGVWQGEFKNRRKDGSVFRTRANVSGLYVGSQMHCVAVQQDITDVSIAKSALLASEERFRTIYEHAPVMIDSFDALGHCTLWNRECERCLGYSFEEIQESEDPLTLFYPDPEVRDAVLNDINLADGRFRKYDVRIKNGSDRTQMWANFRLPDGSIIAVGYDVTDRQLVRDLRATNAELLQSQEELARSHTRLLQSEKLASLGKMSAGVAHEINNPLLVVKGYAQQLRGVVTSLARDEAAQAGRFLDRIDRSCGRMEAIVSRMRDYSRYTDRALSPLDINDVIRDVSELLAAQLGLHGVRLDIELNPEPLTVLGDATRFEQLLINLVLNGRDAVTCAAQEEGFVAIKTLASSTAIHLEVRDNGTGIGDEVLPKIFDPFFSTKAPGEGTGLGLSIAHEIVHEVGGEIECDSCVGVGSTLRIRIPISRREADSILD